MTIKTVAAGIGITLLVTTAAAASLLNASTQTKAVDAARNESPVTLPTATITKQLPQATTTITKTLPPATIITCGEQEDDCYPDYIGKGRWVIRKGERATKSVPPATTRKVPKATTYAVCNNPRITQAMVADCNKLAARPKVIDAQGNETPNGRVLVAECIESYDNALELAICLR